MSKFKPKTTTEVFSPPEAADTSLLATDAKLYGTVDLVPNSERIVAKPVDIMTICADIMQPRRAVPLDVRGDWNGHAQQVIPLMGAWQAAAEESIQQKINAAKILKGLGDGIDYKDAEGKPLPLPSVAKKFIDLLRLGASIHKDKLINPITISRRKELFLIETGERRWLAHHLLHHFVSPKYGKIKATEVERDVWRQATENNNRDELNAIQLARQLALLVMDMYKDDNGVQFDSIETLTFEGCDRRFYAQVENGNVWKIKQGFAERVQAAMGLSSYRMVAAYRKLLRYSDDENLNDEVWRKADSESWTENAIRTYFDDLNRSFEPETNKNTFQIGKVIDDKNTLPIGKVTADSDSQTPDQSGWASSAWVGKLAYSGPVKVMVKAAETADTVIVTTEDGKDHDAIHVKSLREYTEPDSKSQPKDLTAKAVQTVTGMVALVQTDANGYVRLRFPDDTSAQMEKKFVSLVDMSEWYAAVRRHNEAKAAASGATTPASTATTATPKTNSTTTSAADATDSDDFASEPEVLDFTPFDGSNLEILNALTVIAKVLDIEEAEILGDLCNLDRTRLERVLAIEGMAEVSKWEDIYRSAANTVIFAATQRVETHLINIAEFARKITETE